jgi:hypothetical protein
MAEFWNQSISRNVVPVPNFSFSLPSAQVNILEVNKQHAKIIRQDRLSTRLTQQQQLSIEKITATKEQEPVIFEQLHVLETDHETLLMLSKEN